MTSKSKRTHPLDRDGDGAAGGSLPGNQTAPMADAAVDDLADARTTPGDSAEKLEAIERETDEANVAPRQAADTPAEASAMRVLDLRYDAENTGDQAEAAKLFDDANQMADRLGLDRETLEPLAGDTFDAEQVAAASTAGEGAVIAEEGETVADPATATAPMDDGLVNIPTETAPVAVRLHELRTLVEARRLYKSPEGYSSNYGAPYIDQATIDAWIAAGLAEDVPTAGNHGGVRVTAEARSVLNRAPAPEAA